MSFIQNLIAQKTAEANAKDPGFEDENDTGAITEMPAAFDADAQPEAARDDAVTKLDNFLKPRQLCLKPRFLKQILQLLSRKSRQMLPTPP